jgi:hypothetical protein
VVVRLAQNTRPALTLIQEPQVFLPCIFNASASASHREFQSMPSAIALALMVLISNAHHVVFAQDSSFFDLMPPQCEGFYMGFPMLLQQEKEIFPPLPRNLLILFLVLSFMIPVTKYLFRLLKAQVELFLAAANQDEEDLELNE